MELNIIITIILGLFSIFGILCTIIFSLIKLIKNTIKEALVPIERKLDGVAHVTFVQSCINSLTRELVSYKKQTRPTFNAIKTLLLKHGVSIDSEGDCVGDMSHLIGISEKDFVRELKEIIEGD